MLYRLQVNVKGKWLSITAPIQWPHVLALYDVRNKTIEARIIEDKTRKIIVG